MSPDKEVTWRDILLTAGPDYFQLIEDMSNSLDNIIIAQGNINEGFGVVLGPDLFCVRRAAAELQLKLRLRGPHDPFLASSGP